MIATTKPLTSEHIEQVCTVAWFERTFPGVLIFAIPNGGHRGKIVAAKLKAEGVRRGVPDLYVPAWRLWIEMKRESRSSVSPEQKKIHEYLRSIGDTVLICRGYSDAVVQISKIIPAKKG